jgi:hypothetical protein
MALATLVAAVPAVVLGFFLIGTFWNNLEHLRERGMLVALYGTTLAACAAMVFLPIAVLIFGPRSPKQIAGAPTSGSVPKAPPTSVDQSVVEESAESLADEEGAAPAKSSRAMSTGELQVVEPTPSMDDLAAYDDEAIPPSGEMPVVEMDEDFAFDEEPAPPKKKGK